MNIYLVILLIGVVVWVSIILTGIVITHVLYTIADIGFDKKFIKMYDKLLSQTSDGK